MINVCSHLKGLLASEVQENNLHSLIGRLNRLMSESPSTYIAKCKELKPYLMSIISGKLDEFDFSQIEHWPVKERPMWYTPYNSKPVLVAKYLDEPVITDILSNPINDRSIYLLSGLMKLNTAIENGDMQLSRSQRDDAYKSITHTPQVDMEALAPYLKWLPPTVKWLCEKYPRDDEDSFNPLILQPEENKSSFCVNQDGQCYLTRAYELPPYNIVRLLSNPSVRRIYDSDPEYVTALLVTGVEDGRVLDLSEIPVEEVDDPIGIISLADFEGGKPRVVANTLRAANALAEPASTHLFRLAKRWNVQGVSDHTKCVEQVLSVLRTINGRHDIHSVDLHGFTDYFPYKEWQREVLKEFIKNDYLRQTDLLIQDWVCDTPYIFFDRKKNRQVKYNTGTPMGSRLSFILASISHAVLVSCAKSHATGRFAVPDEVQAKVVGDDFCLFEEDQRVFDSYVKALDALYMPISWHKSVNSRYTAELCSKVIHITGIYEEKKVHRVKDVSSLIKAGDYYLEDFNQFDPNLDIWYQKLSEVPQPFGRGNPLEDPFGDCRPLDKLIAIRLVHSSVQQLRNTNTVTREDVLRLHERLEKCPPLVGESHVSWEDRPSYLKFNVLRDRILEESEALYKEALNPSRTLDSKVQAACDYLDKIKQGISLGVLPGDINYRLGIQESHRIRIPMRIRDPDDEIYDLYRKHSSESLTR